MPQVFGFATASGGDMGAEGAGCDGVALARPVTRPAAASSRRRQCRLSQRQPSLGSAARASVARPASAEQAITRLTEDDTVVLVFNDIQMPGTMDGVDLARWLARERPWLKVLLTSGRPAPADARAWPFVAKPYRLDSV
ncbi:MAG: response regulator [Reyranella sp.]|nr:response regulator [Reyranella sp.]MBL6652251.1 response regulator [Reyranella sp.]